MTYKWTTRFLRVAAEVATWSKFPGGGHGCVLVSPDGRQVSWGCTGLPAGDDRDMRAMTDGELRRQVLHAEVNALGNAERSVRGWTMYSTRGPCLSCAVQVLQRGVRTVWCPPPVDMNSAWAEECAQAEIYLKRHGVAVHQKGIAR